MAILRVILILDSSKTKRQINFKLPLL